MTSAARLNYLQIKEQQQLNRERVREAALEEKRANDIVQRQKAQYSHVQSHGYGKQESRSGDVEVKVFIRECDGEHARFYSFMESEAMRGNVATEHKSESHPRNHDAQRLPSVPIRQRKQIVAHAKSSNTAGSLDAQRGIVPKYLLQRKAELAAEKEAIQREAQRQQELAMYPPGHRPLTEEERKETLAKLNARRRELEVELHKIPIRYDTCSIKERRAKIESELSEIEVAERKFSSTKQLFVPI
ncbi:putative Calmodulin binding [Trypanosoma vivax]|uniref:Enkurin domain-containing protein n=1 Tax=Trypanosoma vivax (strain Y486) TaxID=1055687 RepID=G0TV24_TRYVY|nr:hypothetical protein TRVL_04509 [Trypanosoma vivax]KAH8618813.1 putative Calmodulin binding [Trypanosoma vivax]CCC48207.1 conserved hypothetical protein [Trypanosoma vivax Y486]